MGRAWGGGGLLLQATVQRWLQCLFNSLHNSQCSFLQTTSNEQMLPCGQPGLDTPACDRLTQLARQKTRVPCLVFFFTSTCTSRHSAGQRTQTGCEVQVNTFLMSVPVSECIPACTDKSVCYLKLPPHVLAAGWVSWLQFTPAIKNLKPLFRAKHMEQ